MSRHMFTTEFKGEQVEIVMGWDRPLQGFFMTIEKLNKRGCFVFNNLDYSVSHPRDLAVFVKELQALGLLAFVPEEMIGEVTVDGAWNRGNKVVKHTLIEGKYHREVLNSE